MNKSTRITVAVFGVLAGLVGAEHGLGALLQGNVEPESIFIQSWAGVEAFEILNGEPAMTFVPNLFGAGMVTLLVSAAYVLWSIVSVHRKWGPLGMLVLTVTLLLVGGGFGPPLIGFLLCLVATRIRHELTWWRRRSERSRRVLGGIWPWSFTLSLLGFLFLFPGIVLLSIYMRFSYEPAVLIAAGVSFLMLIVTGITAPARDSIGMATPDPETEP